MRASCLYNVMFLSRKLHQLMMNSNHDLLQGKFDLYLDIEL